MIFSKFGKWNTRKPKKKSVRHIFFCFLDDISVRFLERPHHTDDKCSAGIENACPFLVVSSESSALSAALALIFMKLTTLIFTLRWLSNK